MGASAIPAVIDALVAAATTALPNIKVYDGVGDSQDPGDYLMVGVDDPDGTRPANAADSMQDWANATGTARNEHGDVTCAAVSWNGDGDPKAARDAVFATAAAVEDLLRANVSLGVPTLLWTSYGTATKLTQASNSTGALAQLVFRVHYEARI